MCTCVLLCINMQKPSVYKFATSSLKQIKYPEHYVTDVYSSHIIWTEAHQMSLLDHDIQSSDLETLTQRRRRRVLKRNTVERNLIIVMAVIR